MKNDEKITPENIEKLGFRAWDNKKDLYEMGRGYDSVYYFISSKLLIIKEMEGDKKFFDNIITVGDMRKILDKNWR
ncbi:MAG: hypothetical protein K5860_06555 [Bacteroidales bacterium]|nr:hypothetical protein [Bacteroidales bacterium]